MPEGFIDNSKQEDQPTSPEVVLSPETIEKIMEKVVDINKAGTGVTVLSLGSTRDQDWDSKALDTILEKGLLGNIPSHRFPYGSVKHWLVRSKNRNTAVWINIIGRSSENPSSFGVSFVINMSRFKESFPTSHRDNYKGKSRTYKLDADLIPYETIENKKHYPSWTGSSRYNALSDLLKAVQPFGFDEYSKLDDIAEFVKLNPKKVRKINGHSAEEIISNYKENSYGSADTGFMIARRVPPRDIMGVIVGNKDASSSADMPNELSEEEYHNKIEIYTQEQLKIYKGKPELIKPVYGPNGDLLWPKQMSYEEVKRFVEEKSKKKQKTLNANTD